MENKIKKIVLTILLTFTLTLSLIFLNIKDTKAENVDYESYSWTLNYGSLMTNSEAASLSATHYTITSIVDGGSTYAYFTLQYGSDVNNPITNTYVCDFTIQHPTTTTTYILFDFYNKNNVSHIGTTSYIDCRVSYYGSNSSTTSYVYLNSLACPSGANTSYFKYWLSTSGARITSEIVGSSTYSTTTLNNSQVAVQCLNKLWYGKANNSEVLFNNGVNVGIGYGEQRVLNDPSLYGLYNQSQYDVNYQSGYNTGYDAGYNSINTNSIYNNGYNAGYTAGLTSSSADYGIGDLLFSIFNVPISVLSNLFSFNIFGANVWAVIVSLLIITIVIYLIKKVIMLRS